MSDRWFFLERQRWIGEMLCIYGFINREHIMRKFGVSKPQASKDLQQFQEDCSMLVSYNATTKRYEHTAGLVVGE